MLSARLPLLPLSAHLKIIFVPSATCKTAIHTTQHFLFLHFPFAIPHGIKNPVVWLTNVAAPSATEPPPTTRIAVFVI
jgi:hypothetical protein